MLEQLAAAMLRGLQDVGAPKTLLAGWPSGAGAVAGAPRGLPALRHLPSAMAASVPQTEALAAQVIAEVATLEWRQSYTNAELQQSFLDNYGWTEIIGLRGPIRAERMASGFLLLGPRTAYPTHRHAAEELYLPLAGTAFWQRGNRGYAPRPPGQLIHHPPWLPHAMRTSDEPLLALYVWPGDNLTASPMLG